MSKISLSDIDKFNEDFTSEEFEKIKKRPKNSTKKRMEKKREKISKREGYIDSSSLDWENYDESNE